MFSGRRRTTLSSRVKRGAALLDGLCSGWWDAVDLDRLDVRDLRHCVLAQLWGGFGAGLRAVGLRNWRHGFMGSPWSVLKGRYGSESQTLTRLWATEVIHRRRRG